MRSSIVTAEQSFLLACARSVPAGHPSGPTRPGFGETSRGVGEIRQTLSVESLEGEVEHVGDDCPLNVGSSRAGHWEVL